MRAVCVLHLLHTMHIEGRTHTHIYIYNIHAYGYTHCNVMCTVHSGNSECILSSHLIFLSIPLRPAFHSYSIKHWRHVWLQRVQAI